METSDKALLMNRDWDPNYPKDIFCQDFYDLVTFGLAIWMIWS